MQLVAFGALVFAIFALTFTVVYVSILLNRTIMRYTAMLSTMAARAEDERERMISRMQFPDRQPPPPTRIPRQLSAEELAKRERRRKALSSVGTVRHDEPEK